MRLWEESQQERGRRNHAVLLLPRTDRGTQALKPVKLGKASPRHIVQRNIHQRQREKGPHFSDNEPMSHSQVPSSLGEAKRTQNRERRRDEKEDGLGLGQAGAAERGY